MIWLKRNTKDDSLTMRIKITKMLISKKINLRRRRDRKVNKRKGKVIRTR